MRHLVAALSVALCALMLVSSRAGAAPPTQLVQLEDLTQKIRHLAPLRSVSALFLPNAQFDTVVQTNMKRGETDALLEVSRRESVLLGLLSPTADYHKILFQDVTSHVLGLYDYYTRKLYVRSATGKVFGVDRYAIAHEYTHALQDQHYNLKKLMPDQSGLAYRNSDMETAHHALLEGDAVNTQYLYISKSYTPQEIRALIDEPVPATNALPIALEREFDFAYTTGYQFVQALYKAGGMAGVDAGYHRLPRSSYEIMHPSAYLAHWRPVNVALHGVTGMGDWKQVDDDVNGAFGLDVILWQRLPKAVADRVANAYRGDRYIFLENGNQDAMLLRSVWKSHVSAIAAKDAWVHAVRIQFPGASTTVRGATATVAGKAAVYFHVTGSALTVAYAPTTALAQQLGTAPTN